MNTAGTERKHTPEMELTQQHTRDARCTEYGLDWGGGWEDARFSDGRLLVRETRGLQLGRPYKSRCAGDGRACGGPGRGGGLAVATWVDGRREGGCTESVQRT